jgi:penicillin-binding protein 1A
MGYDEPQSLGERESGGGLALPIWIEAMARMLQGVPLQPLVAPGGIVSVGNDWRYAEYAEGGFVPGVGINEPQPSASVAVDAAAAATAASAPTGSTQ